MMKLILETLIHTLLLPGTIIVVIPYLLLSSDPKRYAVGWSPLGLVGVLAILAGAALGTWCARDFVVSGRGTPNPIDPPKLLVAGGPYRLVRNPMYWSVESILLGEALLFRSWALLYYSAVVLLGFHLFVVLYEEPTLRGLFGASYEEYCRSVPRWIPRLRAPEKA